jgi:hypothetical protein
MKTLSTSNEWENICQVFLDYVVQIKYQQMSHAASNSCKDRNNWKLGICRANNCCSERKTMNVDA